MRCAQYISLLIFCGPGQHSGYSDLLWASLGCGIYHPPLPSAGVAQLVQQLATDWTARGSSPGGGEIFRTCPDRPWGPPSLLYNGYRVFPGGKERPGRDADPSPPSSAVVKKEQSYTYTRLWAIRPVQSLSACTSVHFTFTFTCLVLRLKMLNYTYTVEPRSIVPATIVFPHVLFAIFGPELSSI